MENSSGLGKKSRTFAFICASATLFFVPSEVQAGEHEAAHVSTLEGVSTWIETRFSEAEIAALSADDLGVESHFCSCADKPDPHFPYMAVVFTTPRGDLVARAESHEQTAKITPLAVRNGNEYCNLESGEPCYGSFASVCDFTDFRYGPLLEPFFPTCKSPDGFAAGN